MISKKAAVRAGAAFFAVPAAMIMAIGPAMAATDGDIIVTNTETVQAYLNATGQVDVARVYEQVAMKGKGTVDLVDPVETKGLRNLDGFGGFDVKDGNLVGSYEVDGEKRIRTVSDFTKKLPLEVEVKYTLDGKDVKPGDVVGRSGLLKVQYTVRNVTGQPQEVSFNDGTGKTATATEDVVIPMVGSLSTVLPSNFTDVRSDEANMAGDGRGGTKMSFTMTLFGPIGKPEATFGYESQITDGVIPKASISALPVSPLDSPSFKGGAESYKGGAETGATLTAGATEIDANLLKLRDGAGELLAGLIQLRDGADQLNAGLAGSAAPGAKRLSDGATQAASGAGELSSGVGQLDDGANKLSAGADQLKDGTGQLAGGAGRLADGSAEASLGADALADGSAQVADGLVQAGSKAPELIAGLEQVAGGLKLVDGGLVKMYTQIGGLDQHPGVQQLHDGIAKMVAGLGTTGNPATLIGGVEAVRSGITGRIIPGLNNTKAGVDQVKAGHDDALDDGGSIDQAEAAIKSIKAVGGACVTDPVCQGVVDQVAAGVEAKLRDSSTTASAGLKSVSAGLAQLAVGLDTHAPGTFGATDSGGVLYALTRIECGLSSETINGVCDPARPGLLEGLGEVDGGITLLVNTVMKNVQDGIGGNTDTKEDQTLRGGVHSLQGGVDQLSAGGAALLAGLGQLTDGAGLVAEGNADLADGLYQIAGGADELSAGASKLDAGAGTLANGAGQLADGTGKARDGAGRLADGNRQLADGANQLSDGLGDAADGSGKLKDGLAKAADGAPALENGAQRLSDEGTKKLVEAGKSTAADYGQKYALIEAGAKRAKAEGMAYGAPENAAGNTAYSYELAGMDGEGGRNVGRGLGAAAVFGLAGGAAFLRRRFV